MRIVIDLEAAQSPHSRNRGIGRYSTALAKAMLRQRREHEILIVLNGMYADTVAPVRETFEGLLPSTDILVWHAAVPPQPVRTPGQRRAFEIARETFLASLHPDVVHVASVFESGPHSYTTIGDNTVPYRTAVTLYDLIPHLYRDKYLFREEAANAYDNKLGHLKRADLWLAISESSRREGIDHLGFADDHVVNISSAADEHFVPADVPSEREVALRLHYSLWRPFVMYTGGIDQRKNVEGLIEAWAQLPESLRQSHQLAIVCSVHDQDRTRLLELARHAGLAPGEVVLTGFVPEHDLVDLYRIAKLFVFPSLHEGFGLPALEAMRCGTPVIGSDNTSIPEVIGREDALFDARSREAITAKLQQCLIDDGFRESLARHGLERAKLFSWDHSAQVALDAIEKLGPAPEARPPRATEGASRPRLAFVAPLPPARSGIADYSAELLPELAQHYDIDAIVDQAQVDPAVSACVKSVRDPKWLMEHGEEYDRILYHFGNSHFHEYMLPLLAAHPGTVVLHDFYLSGMQANRELVSQKEPHWSRALYESHGWHALEARVKAGDLTGVILDYPANFEVLRDAQGIIVHSPHSQQLARKWYGSRAGDDWRVIPHLRVPLPREREAARASLGVGPDDFLVCSFGIMGPTKLNARLLAAWQRSSLARDPHCHLVFVGENHPGDYGRDISSMLEQSLNGRVRITGWASAEEFRRYLNGADLAVQLRSMSRGETSGTVLDAMNHGVPVIANANGSMAFLSREAVCLLDDEFSDDQLVHALEDLRADAAKRNAMGEAARRLIETLHSPADCARSYAQAIESFALQARTSPAQVTRTIASALDGDAEEPLLGSVANAIAQNLPDPAPARQLLVDVTGLLAGETPPTLPPLVEEMIAWPYPGWRLEPVYRAHDGLWRYARAWMQERIGCPAVLTDDPVDMRREDVWAHLSELDAAYELAPEVFEAGIESISLPSEGHGDTAWSCIAARLRPWNARRCWVDISELVRHDWKSGIQRVVRNHLLHLLREPPNGELVVPVYAIAGQEGYRVATSYLREAAGLPALQQDDAPVDPRAGDTFFLLDLQPHIARQHEAYYRELRQDGVRVAFMVYDLLPIMLPDCFHPDAAQHHAAWLELVAQADLAICISDSVATELRGWLAQRSPAGPFPEIRSVHLGADIASRLATQGLPPEAEALLARMRERPSFLMVGTLEPRKAHASVLAAFDELWSRGVDAALVICGRRGWMTDELVARLRDHPEAGRRLLWIDDASDEFLESIYATCAALILASRGEGFGLPLVEAAQRGLPLIARDLPVFREVAGDHAWYFGDDSPAAFADSLAAWLDAHAKGAHPKPQGMRWLTWEQSTAQLRRVLEATALTS